MIADPIRHEKQYEPRLDLHSYSDVCQSELVRLYCYLKQQLLLRLRCYRLEFDYLRQSNR